LGLSPPSSAGECVPHLPLVQGGGVHSLAGEGVGVPIPTRGQTLVLQVYMYYIMPKHNFCPNISSSFKLGHATCPNFVGQTGPNIEFTFIRPTKYYIEYHSVCPLVGIGTPRPLFRKRVCPPPGTKGWDWVKHTRLQVGGSQFGISEKSLALCLLCVSS
jgi:hypothetical protein